MYTQAPEITNDTTIGEVVSQPTATPTSTSTSETSSTSTSTPYPIFTSTPTPIYSFKTPAPPKRYRQGQLSIYGYGPRNSEVTLKGFGVSESTNSDDNGFFRFDEIYSLTSRYPELCLQAKDEENRTTQPSCIPALPNDSLIPLEVGPILLSPTISLSKNKVLVGEEGFVSGKTSPNLDVLIYFSKKEDKKISLVKDAYAYNFPVIALRSDSEGNFSVSLPTNENADYKIFAASLYGKDNSNKSNSLSFSVLSSIKSFWSKLFEYLLQNKIIAFILFEVIVVVSLLLTALKRTTKRHKHNEGDYLNWIK